MIKKGMLEYLSPLRKILFLLLISISSMLLFMVLGWLSAMLVFDDLFFLITQMTNFDNEQVVKLLKYFQVINQIGLFIIPPLLFAYLDGGDFLSYLKLNISPGFQTLLLSLIMVFAILPLVHWSGMVNEMLRFPEWLRGIEAWMKSSEQSAKEITDAFLSVRTVSGFFFNIFMIAVLPAIGEELLFRGVLQKLLHNWFRNVHWAVFITAIVFSALHLQFYGFLPRTILGVMFGYLFVITKTLWVPILVHFFNNGAAVLAAFLFRKELLKTNYHEFGQTTNLLWVVGSLLMVLLLFTVIIKLSGFQKNNH